MTIQTSGNAIDMVKLEVNEPHVTPQSGSMEDGPQSKHHSRAMGNHPSLLGLPTELRYQIYAYLFESIPHSRRGDITIEKGLVQVLDTCKLIHEEALPWCVAIFDRSHFTLQLKCIRDPISPVVEGPHLVRFHRFHDLTILRYIQKLNVEFRLFEVEAAQSTNKTAPTGRFQRVKIADIADLLDMMPMLRSLKITQINGQTALNSFMSLVTRALQVPNALIECSITSGAAGHKDTIKHIARTVGWWYIPSRGCDFTVRVVKKLTFAPRRANETSAQA